MWDKDSDGTRSLLQNADAEDNQPGGELREQSNEYARLRTVAAGKLQDIRRGRSSDAQADLAVAQKALDDIESIKRRMQVQLKLELSGLSGCRAVWEERMSDWSLDTASLRSEFEEAQGKHSRKQLGLGSRAATGEGVASERPFPSMAPTTSERAAAAHVTEALDQGVRRLEEAKRLAFETEELGQGILSDLASQRDTMLHMRDSMSTVSTELSAARRSVDTMLGRVQLNRLFTGGAAALFAVGLMVYALGFLQLDFKMTVAAAIWACVVLAAGALMWSGDLCSGTSAAQSAAQSGAENV